MKDCTGGEWRWHAIEMLTLPDGKRVENSIWHGGHVDAKNANVRRNGGGEMEKMATLMRVRGLAKRHGTHGRTRHRQH